MEMGKLTAKLRDAVPVCFLVEGKEIKRYKNIEIPDELKMLEYQDFKFDVPLNGNITFKIMFAPGILPEEWPQTRTRRARKPFAQVEQPQESEHVEGMEVESNPLDEQVTEAFSVSAVEAFAQTPEDAQATAGLVAEIMAAIADGEAINAEIAEGSSEGRLLVITAEQDNTETIAQPEDNVPVKKPVGRGRVKKGAATTESTGK